MVCQDKINLQRQKYNILFEIMTCDSTLYTMDHRALIVCSFVENYIGPKRVKTICLSKVQFYITFKLSVEYSSMDYFQEYYQIVKQFGFRSGPKNVEPDLGPNCLQRVPADNTSW